MALALHCTTCDVSVWSSAFYAEGEHRCPHCDELLERGPEAEAAPAAAAAAERED